MAESVEIPEERQREILALEAKLTANHFEVLGVKAGASPEEVRDAFHALSRKFHPDRFHGKNLGSFKSRIDSVFKRLVEAKDILTDLEKRQQYLDSNPFVRAAIRAAGGTPQSGAFPVATPKSPEEEARDAERRARMARHPYLLKATKVHEHLAKAKEHVAKNEFSQAFTMLNIASQIDPAHAEVRTLLVEVRKQYEKLRSETDAKKGETALEQGDTHTALAAFKAAANASASNHHAAMKAARLLEQTRGDIKEISHFAQRAVEADPKNVEYRVFLARTLELAGMKALAKKHFDEAERLNPNHPDVKKYGKKRWPF